MKFLQIKHCFSYTQQKLIPWRKSMKKYLCLVALAAIPLLAVQPGDLVTLTDNQKLICYFDLNENINVNDMVVYKHIQTYYWIRIKSIHHNDNDKAFRLDTNFKKIPVHVYGFIHPTNPRGAHEESLTIARNLYKICEK